MEVRGETTSQHDELCPFPTLPSLVLWVCKGAALALRWLASLGPFPSLPSLGLGDGEGAAIALFRLASLGPFPSPSLGLGGVLDQVALPEPLGHDLRHFFDLFASSGSKGPANERANRQVCAAKVR